MKILVYLLLILLIQPDMYNNASVMGNSSMETNLTESNSGRKMQEYNLPYDYFEYDFDVDGDVEYVREVEGMGIKNYIISIPIKDELIEVGTITVSDDELQYTTLCKGDMKKFYDSQTGSYFYFADYILEKDEWFYYRAVRYEMTGEQMKETLISAVNGICSQENQIYIIADYFDGNVFDARMISYDEYDGFCERVKAYLNVYSEIEAVNLKYQAIDSDTEKRLAKREIVDKTSDEREVGNHIECWGNMVSIDSVEESIYYKEQYEMNELENLVQCNNLAYLYLGNNTNMPLDLTGLCDNDSLKCIWLPENVKTSSISHLKSVEVLLGNVDRQYAEVFSELGNLKFVMLDADSVEVDYFKFLEKCPQLEGVYLTGNVSEEQMNYIKEHFQNIRFVYKGY